MVEGAAVAEVVVGEVEAEEVQAEVMEEEQAEAPSLADLAVVTIATGTEYTTTIDLEARIK